MNPSATVYVPSTVIASTLAQRRATPPVTATLSSKSPGMSHCQTTTATEVPMTAAERLRNARDKGAHQLKSSGATSAPVSSAPILSSSMCASVADAAAPMPMTPPPLSQGTAFIRYSKGQLLSLRAAAIGSVMRGGIVGHPLFERIPESFAPLLRLPFATEHVNVDAAMQLVEHRTYASPLPSSSLNSIVCTEDLADEAQARLFTCPVCTEGGPQPCAAIQHLLQRARRYAMSTKLGAALMQPALVVESLLRLALVFDAKQSSLRLRMLAEQSPRVVHLVEEYLCGEGYHLPLPPVTAHEEWAALNGILKFDAIRDNKIRVITDLSKHWKKRRTQFEQFVYFFAFRDARPVRPAKNIITQSVKPGMVAMLTGDVRAMVLLHRLGFFIPPDYYWSVFPFLRQSLGEGTLKYDVVRHLGLYLSATQPADMYNPVEKPTHA
ncbi:hypothetical protein GH5_02210 [Leishmania sp. Ghana 2012 LV757]|uniref:hypothetical protein n=1 Tax=Leishmania sp. Ghana 2012 LV757 TaxID=2803181 RepID=UPI001B660BB0|nr:hypothetical protein GH5_02210 [Leishmania sp. Ghana 2012 LV757]